MTPETGSALQWLVVLAIVGITFGFAARSIFKKYFSPKPAKGCSCSCTDCPLKNGGCDH
jgi:hypothetical protein